MKPERMIKVLPWLRRACIVIAIGQLAFIIETGVWECAWAPIVSFGLGMSTLPVEHAMQALVDARKK